MMYLRDNVRLLLTFDDVFWGLSELNIVNSYGTIA